MADKAFITSEILKWARESANISVEDAAKKVSVSPERYLTWEDGNDFPTIRQAQILAKSFRRPFSLFFLPEIPKDFQPLQDYRRDDAQKLDTASLFIIRDVQEKQNWISELYEEIGEDKLPFVGKYSINDNPEIVARDILDTLKISPSNYQKTPINEWIDKAETAGIFISRASYLHSHLVLDRDLIQGFAIADKFAPFVFVNSKNWNAPQLFTLVHELAHIWIAKSGISNEIDIDFTDKPKSKFHPVELFCNQVAANALMPTELITQLGADTFDSNDLIFKQAKELGISSFALLVRALNLNLISQSEYKILKQDAQDEFEKFLEREKIKKEKQRERKGGPDAYLLRLNKNSKLFTRIVMDSFNNGSLSPSIASNLLNTQINKFQKFEKLLA
ncbi:M78 family [Maribacter dokdonensis]|jgi:Zn-dependent peptidase ImmA (M78 family)/DNA-binding XRE family transcriptional regulator|uniref:XRE family transcriptional regulator n=1 Tax=Flavobacteriaceae TaxID=49546 RepID=UPI001B2ADC35|nr:MULTISPECIES: XRE family transcriptional regulator [Flavobacteriaceae]CAG2535294.1 M78 family [Maribacter dokdonensis]